MNRPPLPGHYWRQWLASAISNLGDGMNVAAMPLLTYSLTADPRLVSLSAFAAFLPWLILALPVGVYVDRFDRKRLMIGANVMRAALFAFIAVLVVTDSMSIGILLALLLFVGCCEVVFDSSAQAFLPAIVPAESLPRANGLLYATEVVANGFIGLPFGAWLWVAAAGIPFGANAAALTLAAILVTSIKVVPTHREAARTNTSFFAELREGLEWLRDNRRLRTLALLLGVTNMCGTFGNSIFVKYASEEIGVSETGFGILLAAMSIGSIVGGLLGDRIASRLGERQALIGSYAVFGGAMIAMSIAPSAWVVAVIASIEGLAGTVWNVITVSMRQRVIPEDLFGRVNSAYRWIGTGSIGLGALIGGQIAHGFGVRAPFLAGGILTLLALLGGIRILAARA